MPNELTEKQRYATQEEINAYNECKLFKDKLKLFYFGKLTAQDIYNEFNLKEEKEKLNYFIIILNMCHIYDGKIELKEPNHE
jgi:predicted nucleotidyltransferase component of viral defense system